MCSDLIHRRKQLQLVHVAFGKDFAEKALREQHPAVSTNAAAHPHSLLHPPTQNKYTRTQTST